MLPFLRTSESKAKKLGSSNINPEDVFLDSSNISLMNTQQLEGHIERPLSHHTGFIFLGFIFLFFFLFVLKVFSLQITNGQFYVDKSDRNHLKSIPIFAYRGTILDKNQNLLAWNETTNFDFNGDIPKRVYIDEPGFSNLLGYVSYPKKDSSGIFWQDEYIGKDGIEKQYQDRLQGTKGERLVAVDAHNNIESGSTVVYPQNGENIVLTIDKDVQNKLYESIKDLAHKAPFTAGSGVIMNIQTGEILALASYPEYDNNLMTNASTTEDMNQITSDLNDKSHKFLNRPVAGLFTPGSTVKPFIAIAALMEGIITPEKQILSTGKIVIKNKYGGEDTVFRDWEAHGLTDMRKAISESSDEYFYQVGGGYENQKGLGINLIDKYARMFGFGSTTGIDLPNENSGVIPTPEWKKKVFNETWLLGDTYHTAIGQYGFQLTPLELVRGISAIANGGYLVTPHLLKELDTNRVTLGLRAQDLKVITDGMRNGAIDGTGKALNIEGVHVATKSGTAELGVTKQQVNSWISGFFPYENPKYAFVVIMEKGDRHNPYGAVFAMKDTLEWMRDNTDYTK